MNTVEIARKLAAMGGTEDAVRAYTLLIGQDSDPAEKLEAAAYILQYGGDYKVSYTCFRDLYNQGHFREDILPLMIKVFYEPNIKMLQGRYERNCKLLKKYPYLFRKDFLPFEELPFCFFPFDDQGGYVPFYPEEERFGEYVNFKNPVISQNFFHDLERPVLAHDVYSQYELEYLRDNVRRSEDVARENHVYLHYTDWTAFCTYLQCLNLRPLLEEEKLVFLIESEEARYPLDFKDCFGIDYGQYSLQPVRVREVNRLIWHTQLSTHNGGDFFNEIFDFHPNLLVLPSIMMGNMKEILDNYREAMDSAGSLSQAMQNFKSWEDPRMVEELYRMKNRTDKDYLVAMYLQSEQAKAGLDPASRIAPAVFFQPHFSNIVYTLSVEAKTGRTVLNAPNYEEIRKSPVFRSFKYIKTFTPMRRFTTSHGATVRFMYSSAQSANNAADGKSATVVSDAISERIFNRSFMIDPDDRLYKDSILVRFEDGKLNPKAVFTALAAFLDLPYTESMTYCSENGKHDPHPETKGFDPAPIYKTYDDYVNNDERYFIEYFLRDAYEYYGYDFNYYDGAPVDEARVKELIDGFTTVNHYIRETWRKVFEQAQVSVNGQRVSAEEEREMQERMLDNQMASFDENRLANAKILLKGLRFVNKRNQPLQMMRKLELDPALLEQPLYH
nr:hypothetical protein [uncultured Oscillibacter sp.]